MNGNHVLDQQNAALRIKEQIACVKREITMRLRVYPRLIAAGKMTPTKADYEVGAMRAVLATLETVAATEQLF